MVRERLDARNGRGGVALTIRASGPPGSVIAHSPASTGIYLASPAIVRLADGALLAKCDEHGPRSTEKTSGRTRIFHSKDHGMAWRQVATVEGMYWASLFVAKGAVWLLGTERQDGPVVLRRSADGGRTWTVPVDARSGRLRDDGRHHGAPTPVLECGGRIWRGFEEVGPERWGPSFSAYLMSAPVNADWLDSRSWRATNTARFDASYLDGRFGGWCEGNAVEGPDGAVRNILRVHVLDLPEHAAVLRASGDGGELAPPEDDAFPAFPGGCKKFTVRRDPRTGHWFALTNVARKRIPGVAVERTRNEVALVRSTDFRTWDVRGIVLKHPDVHRHAFQYVDWIFDGEDILAVARTAWDDVEGGAHSQHDANHITFHRIARFRSMAERRSKEAHRERN